MACWGLGCFLAVVRPIPNPTRPLASMRNATRSIFFISPRIITRKYFHVTPLTVFDPPPCASSALARWAKVVRALLLGAPANRLSPSFRPTLRQVFSACYLEWRFPLAYALWRELRSVPYRILEIHEKDLAEKGLHLPAVIQVLPDGVRQRDGDGHSRTEDIQNLQMHRPWTTLLDHLLYLEGREAGLASCARRDHSPRYKILPPSRSACSSPERVC